ncbi:MAG TPA: crosslink repair DNA glycosylase YcaQ family protein [Candidatus Limnocylindrales bacterium]
MTAARLELSREQVLGHRRRVGLLDARVPFDAEGLRRACWAGLTDSGPRAAVLQLHARVAGVPADVLDHPALSQGWGPRFSAYVVAEVDAPAFTLGRLPDEAAPLRRAEEMARRLDEHLQGRRMPYGQAGREVGVSPNSFRYGTATGRIRIRWDGARQPEVWTVPPPAMTALEARDELARRFLHAIGPGTAESFSNWAGVRAGRAGRIFEELSPELLAVRTTAGDGWILAADEASFRAGHPPARGVRLLPSGDAYWLCWGADRALLVPDAARRGELWTPRVWPGALLVDGEIAGTWRRADADVSVAAWRRLSGTERAAVEAEAASLPLALPGPIRVHWEA